MDENARKRKPDDMPEVIGSQEKYAKLCKSSISSSSTDTLIGTQNGTATLATLKYNLHELSDSNTDTEEHGDDAALEVGRINDATQTSPRAKNGEAASPACSGSQETVVLSESEDDDTSMNQNNKTVDIHSNTPTPPTSPWQLWKNTSLVGDAETIAAIVPDADSAVVYNALVKNRADPDRLNIATVTILESNTASASTGEAARGQEASTNVNTSETCDAVNGSGTNITTDNKEKDAVLENNGHSNGCLNQASTSDDLFNQAIQLTAEFPKVDQSTIYELLEKAAGQEDAVHQVRETLRAQAASTNSGSATMPCVSKQDSISNDPLVRNDPVFRDMRIISKMFPEKDQNEIYALVEAHYYKADRVQVVIEELLRVERNSQEITTSLPASVELETAKLGAGQGAFTSDPLREKLTRSLSETLLQNDVEHLRCIFPDCDPNYIFERLEACKDVADRVKIIAAEMFEHKNYPRLKDVTEKQTKEARKRHLQTMRFTHEEFLAKFPDPVATFGSEEKEMKDNYKAHAVAQLKHDFPDFKTTFITFVLEKHHFHLLPAVKDLAAVMDEILDLTKATVLDRNHDSVFAGRGRSEKIMRKVPREEPLVYPEEPDEYFFYELWFTLHEQKIKDYFEQKEAVRKVQVEKARERSELYECNCCFEDECLFEEMNVCADGHLFCRQCIARSIEAAFGEGRTVFPCLTGVCEHQIPLSVIKEVLPSSMFSKVLRKLQEEEVRQADIPDLVDCPFCSFATIMADPNDRVFRCLNPECLKDSCRLCREPNHVPLRCEEVEKQSETDMRTYIEKKVTEAMLRKCHRCNKRFVKDAGCNKMTCICGATSCYICREPDIDYDHFQDTRCSEGDMNKVHVQEMERAAEEAKAEYLRDHPEATGMELKYDPLKQIDLGGGNMFGHRYDYDDEEQDRSDMSSYSESEEESEDEYPRW